MRLITDSKVQKLLKDRRPALAAIGQMSKTVGILVNVTFVFFLASLTACGSGWERMKTREVDFGRCQTFVEDFDGLPVADRTVVIRDSAAYARFQHAVAGRNFGDGGNDCKFPTIHFPDEILVGTMLKIHGHEVEMEKAVFYAPERNELLLELYPIVEEAGSSWVLVVDYLVVKGVPRADFKFLVDRGN